MLNYYIGTASGKDVVISGEILIYTIGYSFTIGFMSVIFSVHHTNQAGPLYPQLDFDTCLQLYIFAHMLYYEDSPKYVS